MDILRTSTMVAGTAGGFGKWILKDINSSASLAWDLGLTVDKVQVLTLD